MTQTPNFENNRKIRAIDSLWVLFVVIATTGPFAIPLLWRNPRFSTQTKILGSFAIVLFTALLIWISKVALVELNEILQDPGL